ncbi:MAG: lysoplasmalogenase [Pseudothermotoga sp.]
MRKYIVFLFSFLYLFCFALEVRMPVFDRSNSVCNIYSYDHGDKKEITIVFWDEDHPNPFVDLVYDIYRFFKWGRFYDVETFFVLKDHVLFEDDYCDSHSYYQFEGLHNSAEIPIDDFERTDNGLTIYVSTWNHMFSNRALANTEYMSFTVKGFSGTRKDAEKIYSWRENIRLRMTLILSFLMIFMAAFTICLKNRQRNITTIKVLTTLCAVFIALMNVDGSEWFIVFGLIFGAIGDAFLEKPEKFIYGMGSFLIGHLFYSVGFGLRFAVPPLWLFVIIFLVLLTLYFTMLYKHLSHMRFPIFVYLVAIGAMFSFSFSPLYKSLYYLRFLLPLAGGLFVFSDFLIAVDKFVKRVPARHLLILGTYFMSQLIISLSTIF